jgi:hypothetical protein
MIATSFPARPRGKKNRSLTGRSCAPSQTAALLVGPSLDPAALIDRSSTAMIRPDTSFVPAQGFSEK